MNTDKIELDKLKKKFDFEEWHAEKLKETNKKLKDSKEEMIKEGYYDD